jgi:hypothetical protein
MSMTPTLDSTLPRTLAGYAFRRADTARDERGAGREHAFEQFLGNLPGWLPPGRGQAADIAALDQAVRRVADELRPLPDAAVAERFHTGVAALKRGGRGMRDRASLAALFARSQAGAWERAALTRR